MERAEESFRPRRVLKPVGMGRRLSLSAVILLVALASLFAYAKSLRAGRGQYELADDCPRGALVYAQASDFPALLRLWDGSKLKERYLASTNFRQFAGGHVALRQPMRTPAGVAEVKEEVGGLGFVHREVSSQGRVGQRLFRLGRRDVEISADLLDHAFADLSVTGHCRAAAVSRIAPPRVLGALSDQDAALCDQMSQEIAAFHTSMLTSS